MIFWLRLLRKALLTEKVFQKGDVIFRQGDDSRDMYQILEGAVGVYINYGQEEEKELTHLKPGEFFGELAAIEYTPRSATTVALEDGTKVQEIAETEAGAYLEGNPENAALVMKHISSRLRDLTREYQEVTALTGQLEKGEEETVKEGFWEKVRKHLSGRRSAAAAADAPSVEACRAELKDGYAGKVESYPKGTVIFREGETGDCMYAIHWGEVGIYSGYGTDAQKELTTLAANTFFGEMGMISGEPRSATAVVLMDNTSVETISPDGFHELTEKNPPKASSVLQHLAHRLRQLTFDHEEACEKLAKISPEA